MSIYYISLRCVYMKIKLLATVLLAIMLIAVSVSAVGNDNATGMGNKTGEAPEKEAKVTAVPVKTQTGEGDMLQTKEQVQEQLQEQLQAKEKVMAKEMSEAGKKEQKALQNQNEVRTAVQAMQMLGNMSGGIGKEVSAIAKEFNNSVQKTLQAETQIEKKGGLARLFTGGDAKAAETLEKEVQTRAQELTQLKTQAQTCDCEQGVKEMLQEQIKTLEQEQTRLGELAQKEKSKKGILGWMWK